MSHEREITEDFDLRGVLRTAAHSTVFQAVDPQSQRVVALKLLSTVGPHGAHADRQRFQRALGVVQFLRVPGVPILLDFGITPDGSAFMVMDHEEGEPIRTHRGGPPERLVRLLAEAATGLEALAEGGVFHHNLTGDNLQVVQRQGAEHVLLLGLGTAAFFTERGVGRILPRPEGEQRFLAPELLDLDPDAGGCDWTADLYSLAVVACDVLGASIQDRDGEAPEVALPEEVESALVDAASLRKALASALHPDPELREPSLSGLAAAMRASIGIVAPERGAGHSKRPRRKAAKGGRKQGASQAADPRPATPPDLPTEGTVLIPPPLMDAAVEARDAEAERATTVLPPTLPLARARREASRLEEQPEGPAEVGGDREAAAPRDYDPNRTNPNLVVELPGEAPRTPPPVPPTPPPITPPPAPGRAAGPPGLVDAMPRLALAGRRWLAIAGGAVVVLAVAVVAVLWLRGTGEEPAEPVSVAAAPATAAPTEVPTAPPAPSIHPALGMVQSLLEAEDLDGAREALEAIPSEDVDGFSDEETALYETLLAELAGEDIDQAAEDLRGGLEIGSVKMLQRSLAVLEKVDAEALPAGVAGDVERARRALRAHTLLWRARDAGDHPQVLERAAALIGLLPGYSRSYDFREESAAALEARAETAERSGNLDQAIAELQLIAAHWPDRPGLAARIDRCRQRKDQVQRQQAVLAEALATLENGDPMQGLALLGSVTPEARLADRFASARARLVARLAELDAGSPVVALVPGAELEYKKNEGVSVPFRIGDDYGVVRATAMVRASTTGSSFEPMPLRHQGAERWVLEITPEVHGNKTVELYVEATDRSGNVGRLGTPDAPLEVKKTSWFRR